MPFSKWRDEWFAKSVRTAQRWVQDPNHDAYKAHMEESKEREDAANAASNAQVSIPSVTHRYHVIWPRGEGARVTRRSGKMTLSY